MDMYHYCLILVATLLQINAQNASEKGKEYRAAVVEYNPSILEQANIFQYELFIKAAAKNSSCDIIVFPEGSLSINIMKKGSLLPNPEDKIVPYKNETYKKYEAVKAISEAAATHKIYVVINLHELEYCTNATKDCPDRGYFLYNTNVAFDRNGTVIAKYRKYNLYDEGGVNKPQTAELSTFTTDFGVTFGMFICFDILFKSPTIDLVRKRNVTNLIFSTFWFGELPFLTAAQVQSGWSYAMDVNLLASGTNLPLIGSTGSGIYDGRSRKISCMFEKPLSMMIVAEANGVNRSPSAAPSCESNNYFPYSRLYLKEDPSITNSLGKDLDSSNDTYEEEICHNGLCCRFYAKYRKVSGNSSADYTYRAVAFQGERTFGSEARGEVAYCAILLCTAGNCAKKPKTGDYPLAFDDIKIEADFDGNNTFQMPSTLVWNDGGESKKILLQTMDYENFAYESKAGDKGNMVNVRIELRRRDVGNLLTFGIFGRKFD